MVGISFGALPCRKKKPDNSSRLDVVEIARVPDMLPSLFALFYFVVVVTSLSYILKKIHDKIYLSFQNILTKNMLVPEIQKRVCRPNIRYSSILHSGGFRLK